MTPDKNVAIGPQVAVKTLAVLSNEMKIPGDTQRTVGRDVDVTSEHTQYVHVSLPLGRIGLAAQTIPPVLRSVVCLSVSLSSVCHICAPCLNRSTGLDAV